MNIKERCDQIIDAYENPAEGNAYNSPAIGLVYQISFAGSQKEWDEENLSILLKTTIRIASTKKSLKQILEKELLRRIAYLPVYLWGEKEGRPKIQFSRSKKKRKEGWLIYWSILPKKFML